MRGVQRAIVFDVGNTLYDWDPRFLYEKLIPDQAARADFLAHVVTRDWHFAHDLGVPFAETSAALIARFPEHADLVAAWGPRFAETIPAMLPGMADLVAALTGADVALYALTNFSGEFWPPFRAREAALFDRFAGIVVSGDEGMAKPDPAIYHLALTRFGLKAAEAVFIDDRADNVAAAAAIGMTALRFTDAVALRCELTVLGVLPAG